MNNDPKNMKPTRKPVYLLNHEFIGKDSVRIIDHVKLGIEMLMTDEKAKRYAALVTLMMWGT